MDILCIGFTLSVLDTSNLPAESRVFMQSGSPSCAAINNGDALSTVNFFTSAPSFSSSFKQESLPYWAAVNKGVAPSLFCILILAPQDRSLSIKSCLPAKAASCSPPQPPTSWLLTSKLWVRKIWNQEQHTCLIILPVIVKCIWNEIFCTAKSGFQSSVESN